MRVGFSVLLLHLVFVPLHPAIAQEKVAEASSKRPMPPFISPAGKPYRSEVEEPYAKAKWFGALDSDQNGELIAEDFVMEAERFFKELDTDSDGRIALGEIVQYEQVVAPEVQAGFTPAGADGMRPPPGMSIPSGMGGGPPGGMGDGPPGRGSGGPPSAGGPKKSAMKQLDRMPQGAARFAILGMPQPIMAADTNFNGSVTLDEMRASAVQRFGWLDALGDGNGKLLWDELPETPVEDMMNLSKMDKKKKGGKEGDDKPPRGLRRSIP